MSLGGEMKGHLVRKATGRWGFVLHIQIFDRVTTIRYDRPNDQDWITEELAAMKLREVANEAIHQLKLIVGSATVVDTKTGQGDAKLKKAHAPPPSVW